MVKPLLADQLLTVQPNKALWSRAAMAKVDFPALQARVRRAERMVFDAEASKRVGEVLREIPELLVEQIQFARAPFDLCWIEYEADVIWRELVGHDSDDNDPDRDQAVGLLIDHNRINVFCRSFNSHIGMMPYVYHLNTEWPLEDQLRFCEISHMSRLGIDLWLWGSTSNHFIENGQQDRLRLLRDTTMVEILDERTELVPKVFSGSVGDFKNVVALLLMLNMPRITQYIHTPMRRGWIGNKPNKPFLSHHTVVVSLDARTQLVSHGAGGDGELRRNHRVRGHYCHDHTARDYARIAGCVHDWEPMTEEWEPWPNAPLDEREHWKCRACDGKRWWRVAHTRGSEKGFIEHEYRVTV